MRLLRLMAGDIRFQWKYGFYSVYAVFTAVYLMTLAAVTESARRVVATVMIYSDPAAMGLFFMGAIILLEKSQRVDCALATTPIRTLEYLTAKLISLAVISLIVGAILAVAGGVQNLPLCLAAILLASVFCSACGLIAAERSQSLNRFVLWSMLIELILCLPALLLFGIENPWLMLHPGVAAVWVIHGGAPSTALCLLSLAAWCVAALWLGDRSVKRYFAESGGAAL
ncbi:MAG: ABC transporter permease [Syntrophomonadaceae bacterium]|nr:ABC transporter permease [Syntrophomonadaceae bacterium]